jgi:ATP-dependent DNA helicase RecQ
MVRKALSAVARVHGRFGLNAAVQLLRGEADDRLIRARLDETRTFGILKDYPEKWLLSLLRRCVTAGWVDFIGGNRPLAILTEAGVAVMKGAQPVRLLLPARQGARPMTIVKKRDRTAGAAMSAGAAEALDADAARVFEALRRHRLDVARDENVPPYVVASDRTLRDLATLRPRNLEELKLAHGIGPAKADRFGPGLLQVIASEGRA